MKQLEDLDFADDISLLSRKQQDALGKLRRVAEEARKIGLQINIAKTEAMRINNKQADPLRLQLGTAYQKRSKNNGGCITKKPKLGTAYQKHYEITIPK